LVPNSLKVYIAGLVVLSAVALIATSLAIPIDPRIAIEFDGQLGASLVEVSAGLAFWILVTLVASALPVRVSADIQLAVSTASLMAATNLGGPSAGALVALIGTTELRELRGRVVWYGTLTNHAAIVVPVLAGGLLMSALRGTSGDVADFLATIAGSLVYFLLNFALVSVLVALRHRRGWREVVAPGETANFWANLATLAPLGWLMTQIYSLRSGWWATLLFALPLLTTRTAVHRFVEMREMFTQTIGALAEAVDKRDPYTSKHSQNVRTISVDIGREMSVSAAELEALEWGGLLHDVGKIGVPDNILLKQDRLTREERMVMNAHPVLGAEIIAPVTRLAAELPIIRHHHEWYNGSGYPDRLMGDEIPRLARILHVADAFEAMTAARPYRMTPLTAEQALAELRKFAGIQFDPEIVDAFVRTRWAQGIRDPGQHPEPRPIQLITQHANRVAQAAAPVSPAALPGSSVAPGSPAADVG
jgi:putative nucleotidyltransferase with HDIG domain